MRISDTQSIILILDKVSILLSLHNIIMINQTPVYMTI